MIVSADRSSSTDAGAEHVEERDAVGRRPSAPPDRPGQEPEGVQSRLDAHKALAAENEQAAERPAEATDQRTPKSTNEQDAVVAERKAESPVTPAEDRSSPYDAHRGEPGDSAPALTGERDTHVQLETDQQPQSRDDQAAQIPEQTAAVSDYQGTDHRPGVADSSAEARTGLDQRTPDESPLREVDDGAEPQGTAEPPSELDAETAREERTDTSPTSTEVVSSALMERADQPHEVKPPQIVGDYYTNVPPTAPDRYLVRDQANPLPVFDGSPTRDQVAQGSIGDCGLVATLGSVAEHRPDAIKDAIKQVGDGEYEITLHDVTEATPADPVARPTGDVTTYRVNDELPVNTDHPSRPPAGIQAESCGWPALTEKVIAGEDQTWEAAKKTGWDHAWTTRYKPAVDQERAGAGLGPSPHDAPTGYNRLDIGSTSYQRADLLAKLTGEEAEVRRIPGERQGERALLDSFQDQLDDGKPILVGSRGRRPPTERFPNRIVPGHAYEITKIENDKIHMHNPWGHRHPDPMDTKTFWEYYRRYNQDGTRDGDYTTLK